MTKSANRGFTIVGIGASAGGLDACIKFVTALPAACGMAFILIQHLDPTHESMMADLLAGHTSMPVRQATDGMLVERDHFYVIPPGAYLSIVKGALKLSQPPSRPVTRLPFDFLLNSLTESHGARCACVILSGNGPDGSLGLTAIKRQGGLIIAQDPEEAAYDGMPRSALMTGAVDLVLPVAKIPEALLDYDRRIAAAGASADGPSNRVPEWLSEIIELLRAGTPHDFTLYKPGTLQRRIERRMAMSSAEAGTMHDYIEILRRDPHELDLVAKDLLINVTGFFRDPASFDALAETVVPDLIRDRSDDRTVRVWVAGCSTGEEAYSIAILFREAFGETGLGAKVQVFASDVDPDAVAIAREGLFPETIGAEVSAERLARFFAKEDRGYRVLPELREAVLFAVQDLLSDPPFSRLDMVSCRNVLIYLGPEAQAKAMSTFQFALREGGILVLGGSETAGNIDGRFEVMPKAAGIYRHIGRGRPVGTDAMPSVVERVRTFLAPAKIFPRRRVDYADLCHNRVLEAYAPAAVLVNLRHECLYSMGPMEHYLRVAAGYSTLDVLRMAPEDVRPKLRLAMEMAVRDRARALVHRVSANREGGADFFSISVEPISTDGEDLLLICFLESGHQGARQSLARESEDPSRIAELERELASARAELSSAMLILEQSSEAQRAVNEEALSASEESQLTNEELLTSKEEMQSLNEELTILNSQLQETLERQRTTSDDLQNVLYSTNVATLFLDVELNIRFFTPATRALFNVRPSDVGRPLADLNSPAADRFLPADAKAVMKSLTPLEREVEAENGVWFVRRVLPYRTNGQGIGGVVITFTDVTDRKVFAKSLEDAKQQAEISNLAKSRFLAAASHDLRQPLQSLVLLRGLLAKAVEGKGAQDLVARLDHTLGAMSGMLNTLLDINQIEAGVVRVEVIDFALPDLLDRLKEEFTYHARAQHLDLRVVPCSLVVRSDPRLLEQMVRNLVSNALKYTRRGKVLLGCRRREGALSIEIWDTGVGIPGEELEAIFEEYHQLDNASRERSLGLGLGLPIVQRLGRLLGHRIRVRSQLGKGSAFAIDVAMPPGRTDLAFPASAPAVASAVGPAHRRGAIMVVEDDPELRGLIKAFLENEGHSVSIATDGTAVIDMVAGGRIRPDLILSDYNLPNGLNGLEAAERVRAELNFPVPVIILTGDISTKALSEISLQKFAQLSKPVRLEELTLAIQAQLSALDLARVPPPARAAASTALEKPEVVFVVDDDASIRREIRGVLEANGQAVEDYPTCEAFLEGYRPGRGACLLIDAYLPGMNGLQLLRRLRQDGDRLPAIMITGNSDVHMAVEAMKAGASDFIEKPVGGDELLTGIARASEQSRDSNKLFAWREAAAHHVAGLTSRQRQIMDLVLAGQPSKNIAADLGISQRTVENHRASIMKKTGSQSLPALARLALAAASNDAGVPLADPRRRGPLEPDVARSSRMRPRV